MKIFATAGLLALLACPAVASAQAAAATLPDAFDGPAAAQRPMIPPAAADEVQAPDVARSEAALRSIIAALQAGAPDYTVFTDDLAAQIRQRAGEIGPLVQGFGAVQAVAFVGEQNGAELFSVAFANQRTVWLIGFNDDDRIAALLFRPIQAEDEPQS
ncbi:MAG: hypothetical protein EON88_22680 [Brevundimonas sp.]|nr:MAG: hypothetical protein EON88_22680 [Brevundimonas sp.]